MLMRFKKVTETTDDLCEEKIVNVEYDGEGCFTAYFHPTDDGTVYYFTFYRDEWELLKNPTNVSNEPIPS